ncbi:hypothetical protein OIO90_005692 [Microbotryomycetes sp. JL221]|nr:hypothetical protein OIO90_005692 [Microbotryomycetes sp. JL221]
MTIASMLTLLSELNKTNADLNRTLTLLRAERLSLKGAHFQLECENASLRTQLDRQHQRQQELERQIEQCTCSHSITATAIVDQQQIDVMRQSLAHAVASLQACMAILPMPSSPSPAAPPTTSPASAPATPPPRDSPPSVKAAIEAPSNVSISRRRSLVSKSNLQQQQQGSNPSSTTQRPSISVMPDLSFISEGAEGSGGEDQHYDDEDRLGGGRSGSEAVTERGHNWWSGPVLEGLREETTSQPTSLQASPAPMETRPISSIANSSPVASSSSSSVDEGDEQDEHDQPEDVTQYRKRTSPPTINGAPPPSRSAMSNNQNVETRKQPRRASGLLKHPHQPVNLLTNRNERDESSVSESDQEDDDDESFVLDRRQVRVDGQRQVADRIMTTMTKTTRKILSEVTQPIIHDTLMNKNDSDGVGNKRSRKHGDDQLKQTNSLPATSIDRVSPSTQHAARSGASKPSLSATRATAHPGSNASTMTTTKPMSSITQAAKLVKRQQNQTLTTITKLNHGTRSNQSTTSTGPSGRSNYLVSSDPARVIDKSSTSVRSSNVDDDAHSDDQNMNSTGEAGGRRARKSVNYALPKLNTKMRRPEDYVPQTKTGPRKSTKPLTTMTTSTQSDQHAMTHDNKVRTDSNTIEDSNSQIDFDEENKLKRTKRPSSARQSRISDGVVVVDDDDDDATSFKPVDYVQEGRIRKMKATQDDNDSTTDSFDEVTFLRKRAAMGTTNDRSNQERLHTSMAVEGNASQRQSLVHASVASARTNSRRHSTAV